MSVNKYDLAGEVQTVIATPSIIKPKPNDVNDKSYKDDKGVAFVVDKLDTICSTNSLGAYALAGGAFDPNDYATGEEAVKKFLSDAEVGHVKFCEGFMPGDVTAFYDEKGKFLRSIGLVYGRSVGEGTLLDCFTMVNGVLLRPRISVLPINGQPYRQTFRPRPENVFKDDRYKAGFVEFYRLKKLGKKLAQLV